MRDILSDRPIYRETQTMNWLMPWIGTAALVVLVALLLVFRNRASGLSMQSWAYVVALSFAVGTLPILLIRMVCSVDRAGVSVQLFPFWTRRVSWRDVGGVEVRSFSPIREYGGWGIRYNLKRREWAYIVRGGRGVSLELDGGTRLLIGSQKPEALADAIRSAMAGSRSGL